jgi:hypothetical protein
MKRAIAAVALAAAMVGCGGSYTVPAGGVSPVAIQDNIGDRKIEQRVPTVKFPARVAVVRIQQSGYSSMSTTGASVIGSGRFSVVTTRELESQADIETLMKLPRLAGLAQLNRLVLPDQFRSDADLREAAARLQCELLLLYTVDSSFNVVDKEVGPLNVIALGTLPNQRVSVNSSVAGALFDVKTGYIYGLSEGTGKKTGLGSIWRKEDAIDEARIEAERLAFADFIKQTQVLWMNVVQQYDKPAQ